MSAWVLQVSAGTGSIEVRRFVAMLADHLAARCREHGAVVSETVVHGDERAPMSVEVHLEAAPPSIAELAGTHALVARSADRGRRSRKRWYAGVRVHEQREEAAVAEVDPREVEITATRAGGPGGQHVNKTSSAVRVRHLPTGVLVRVADERSQHRNVRIALARLSRILQERAGEDAQRTLAERRMAHYRVERGRPAFVYVTRPKGGLLRCDEIGSR